MNDSRDLALRAYSTIDGKANANSITQGISGMAGFPWTIAVDAAVVPTIYVPMWNDIRGIYGHAPLEVEAMSEVVGPLMMEVLADLVLDKVLGQVPLLGIYFNAICAKSMTWRLGTLFAFLSSRGSEIPQSLVKDAIKLIRLSFPQHDMFKFQTPNKGTFVKLVTSVEGQTELELKDKLNRALECLS